MVLDTSVNGQTYVEDCEVCSASRSRVVIS